MVALYEKFRPKSFDEFIGFSDAVSRIQSLRDCIGLDGQVFWITGGSGWGKTSVARLIAAEVANEIDIEEVDAQDVKLETLDQWMKRCHYYPQKEAYAFIVNEAHTLLPKTVSKLQTFLEEPVVQKHGTFLFTTTDRGHQRLFDTRFDAFPFLSRAIMIDLELDEDTCQAMVHHLAMVESSLGRQVRPLEAYRKMLIDNEANLRKCLQEIAAGSTSKRGIA